MWVPGQEKSKPAANSPVRSPVASIPAASAPSASVSNQPKDNLLAALAYVTFIPALVFVLVEPFKRNRFIRFHSFQSIFLAVATIVAAVAMRILYSVLALVPLLGFLLAWLLSAVVSVGLVVLWLVLLVKALQGETFRLPWIGDLAEKM
jgi:uncharacterized membrane protein